MSEILFQYHRVNPTTWVYLSSLLTIGLYFKFSRLWSVRNLDLIGLILFSPGLLMVHFGLDEGKHSIEQAGYIWLFAMSGIFLIRLLLDPLMVRRPLLEPNLSAGGMTFIGTSLLIFLMANVINSKVAPEDLAGAKEADQVRALQTPEPTKEAPVVHGPGNALLHLPPVLGHMLLSGNAAEGTDASRDVIYMATARTMAIASHIVIVIGMVLIGFHHFDNIKTGIAAALLYLLLPYTAQMTGRVDHVLPAALLVLAIAFYRRPAIAGIFIGLGVGVIYYPIFLLPLWVGFYWQRGLVRFLAGIFGTLSVLLLVLWFTSENLWLHIQHLFSWMTLPKDASVEGFWSFEFIPPVYRVPVLAAFLALCGSLALWPAQKNLGTLMSCSAAVMLGTQFWHARGGGLYMAWYLPLLLLTIFRPNLEDRIALSVLGESWFYRKRLTITGVDRAA